MKRLGNLYKNICEYENISKVFSEVCKNTRNKRKVAMIKDYKTIYIARTYQILKEKKYVVGPYNKFIIYEPKKRNIYSQGMQDKIINHFSLKRIKKRN